MKHGFAIICEARKGHRQGIEFLALVDRSKTTKRWWTSDDSSLILQINDVAAADRVAVASVDRSLLVENREPGAVVLLGEVIRADQKAQTRLMLEGVRCPFLPVDEW